jgi:peptidoglycan hydrolase CwlO-like protein
MSEAAILTLVNGLLVMIILVVMKFWLNGQKRMIQDTQSDTKEIKITQQAMSEKINALAMFQTGTQKDIDHINETQRLHSDKIKAHDEELKQVAVHIASCPHFKKSHQ